jgi:dTDP-4-amino-4,6-dideoxygalactose transaminase
MPVPLLDLKAQYTTLRSEMEAAIRSVCEEQRFVLGPRVANLESEVAAYSQAAYGLGVSSGTDALLVALMALDIGPGDEVITTPFTFFATGGVVARLGARPFFCDIDPLTFNLDAGAVRAAIERQCERRGGRLINRSTGGVVKVLLPVHLFGQMADLDALSEVARTFGLAVVEDAAQAIGAALADGRRAGSVGAIGCFSFFPTKNLGAFGDAGMCVTNDKQLADRLRILRVHGGEPKYYHAVIGGNFRLDELQAAVLLVKLARLESWTEARRANAAEYDALFRSAGLGETVSVPFRVPGYRHIFNQYVIRAQRRDELRAHLTKRGIGTEIYYPLPLHAQRCFAYLGHSPSDFPHSERAAAEVLALPIYPELTAEQRQQVVRAVSEFYS